MAAVPLFGETLRCGLLPVRVVRIVACDHSVTSCGISIEPGYEDKVIRAMVDALCGLESWDLIYLGPLAGYYGQAEAVVEGFRSCRQVGAVTLDRGRHGSQTLLDLPASYEEYLRLLPRYERRNIQRRCRRLAMQHGFETRVVTARSEVDAAFDELVRMHEAQWVARGRLGHFGDWPGAIAFHRDMLRAQSEHGRAHFVELRSNGRLLATQYQYQFGRRVHMVLAARTLDRRWSRFGPGKLVHAAAVRHAISAGVNQVDDMKGYYDYKLRLGGRVVPFVSISVVRQGRGRRSRVRLLQTAARLLNLVYYRVWFCRVSVRLPWFTRPLWKTWIRSRL